MIRLEDKRSRKNTMTSILENFMKNIDQILVGLGVNTTYPQSNSIEQLVEARKNIIEMYNEKKITKGEFVRSLFEVSQLMRKLPYGKLVV